VAFKKQIDDPRNSPFPTPSGKIEIYSQRLADMSDPHLPPVPKYIETWESRNDPLAKEYPLQLITTHYWRRTHSRFDNVPWTKELEAQSVFINSADAQARGIKEGDMVRVFNDRGQTILPASVTSRSGSVSEAYATIAGTIIGSLLFAAVVFAVIYYEYELK